MNRSWVKIGFFAGFNKLCNDSFNKTLLLPVSGYSFLIWGYFLSAGRALDDGTCHGTAECHSVEKPSSYGLWKKTRVDYAQGGPVPVLNGGITTINGAINGQLGFQLPFSVEL